MKGTVFFDELELSDIKALVKVTKKKLDWSGTGSMLIMQTKTLGEFEVYLLRGIVRFSKKELNKLRLERKEEAEKK